MHRTLEYCLLFMVLVLIQVFLLNEMNLSVYVNPMLYIGFIVLLPLNIRGVYLLLLALLLGVTMDFFMGTAGVNTIATLFAAFCRPAVLRYLLPKEDTSENDIPNVRQLGRGRFMRYALAMILLHGIAFYTLESLTWSYFYLTVVRIVASGGVTLLLLYVCQHFFSSNLKKL